MIKTDSKMHLHSIYFLGNNVKPRGVNFNKNVKVINGASNTGKSFLVESLEYMLGKESIDQIDESKQYTEILLKVTLNSEDYTFLRSFNSKVVDVFKGHIDQIKSFKVFSSLKIGSLKKGEQSFSAFLMKEWHQEEVELVKNLSAKKAKLTIRLLSNIYISEEDKIISKHSPIESGIRDEKTTNRALFTYLLTGNDNSSLDELTTPEIFNSKKSGRTDLLNELIDDYKSEVTFKNDSLQTLKESLEKNKLIQDTIKQKLNNSRQTIASLLINKKDTSKEIATNHLRINDIKSNLSSFKSLRDIYESDIKRLESQEEAAFLLSSNHNGYCGTCGQKSDNICDDLEQLKILRIASLAEIQKIKSNRKGLLETKEKLEKQLINIEIQNEELKNKLHIIEEEINLKTPFLESNEILNSEKTEKREAILRDISLLEKIHNLKLKLQEADGEKPPKRYKSEDFLPTEEAINSFCEIYSEVLDEIKFPGNKLVTFDYKDFDVVIDGKHRRLNGKGVRAILHSVFKITLLLYCSRKKLFHPKILVLDSPLVTYRDPKDSKHGELDNDEKIIANTKLSFHFLDYLSKLSNIAQFIIIENIDIPAINDENFTVETFHGKNAVGTERNGLF
ncbi:MULTISPECIES: hypothetical protein [Pseudoalteromonas]|uniref:hypothetical protein n=1 Tax=Pseudoalteromonas TaxID=53246 RepID=UPI00272B3BE4|nr:hypothetical protein [Pseudoalteromonas sp.]